MIIAVFILAWLAIGWSASVWGLKQLDKIYCQPLSYAELLAAVGGMFIGPLNWAAVLIAFGLFKR